MSIDKKRARVFVEYTLTALILQEEQGSAGMLTVRRSELARILKVAKLFRNHIEAVRSLGIPHGIGMVNLGDTFAFFEIGETKNIPLRVDEVIAITDRFEKVYGSDAADEMWNRGEYRVGKTI